MTHFLYLAILGYSIYTKSCQIFITYSLYTNGQEFFDTQYHHEPDFLYLKVIFMVLILDSNSEIGAHVSCSPSHVRKMF